MLFIILLIGSVFIIVYSFCEVSSNCSRMEEEEHLKNIFKEIKK